MSASMKASFSMAAKKILSVMLTMLLVAACVLCVSVAVNNAKGNSSFFGYGFYYVVTGSMEPTIHTGAAILVRENPDGIYEVGDIVTFTSSNPEIYGKPNTHRIIAVDESSGTRIYTTQGDANSIPDAEALSGRQIRGKLVWNTGSLVWVADLMGFLTTPVGFISVIILPVLLVAVNQMKEFTKEFRTAVAETAAEASGINAAAEETSGKNAASCENASAGQQRTESQNGERQAP